MKKVLSTLLALIMVVSCMAGITFSVAAEETTVDLYGGTSTGNFAWSTNGSTTSFGQVLTIAEGKAATGLQLNFGGSPARLKLSVYRYVAGESILKTVAGAPLYTETFTSQENVFNNFTFDTAITGSIYWEITNPDGYSGVKAMIFGYNADITETADGSVTGIEHVMNGVLNAAPVSWNSATKSIGARLVLDSEATATNTAAPVTEEVPLYTNGLAGNIAIGQDWNSTSFGQKFTVAGDRKIAVWSHQLATKNSGAGNLSFYKWKGDYSNSVASEPLYSIDFTCSNNNTLRVQIPDNVKMTGELLWVVTPTTPNDIVPYGAKGLGDGCIDFINGTATTTSGGSYGPSGWSGAVAMAATLGLNEYNYAPTGEAETVPLFTTVGGSQYNGKAKGVVGQSLTVPAGKILTGINIRYMCTEGYAGTATGTFALYQWAGSYAETVSRTPLYSQPVSHSNNQQNITYTIPSALMVEGAVLWTLTPDANSAQGFAPWGAKDQAAGVTSYYNGVAKALNNYGEYIESTINVLDGGIYKPGETASTNLFSGALSYNAAIWSQRSQYSGDGYGQIIMLEDGQRLTSMSNNWMYWGGNTTVTIEFFQYAGKDTSNIQADVAATLAGEALYSESVTPAHNGNTTITIPNDVMLTGMVMWYVRDPFVNDTYTQSVVPGGAAGYVGDAINLAGGRIQGTSTGVTGWANAAATDTIATWITTESVGYTYINSIDKSIIYSGTMLYGDMYPAAQDAFAAKANRYAEGEWGAWDGTFNQVGNVFYTNHTYPENTTVNGESVTLEGDSVVAEAPTAKEDGSKFLYWSVNGNIVSNAPSFKWYPQSATDTIVAVYEGEGEAVITPPAPAVKVDRDGGKLVVTVTPAHLSDVEVVEYGYYISVGTAIMGSEAGVAGAKKDAANLPTAAYQSTTYSLKPATQSQTIYVVTYVTYLNGSAPTTVYGSVVTSAA